MNPGLFPDSRSLNDMPEPYAALLAETDQPVERRTDINSFSFQGRAITLSPMPVQGLMYMETSTNIEVVDFVNAAGEVIWHRDTDGRTFHFDISEIPAGVYSLKLNDEPVRGIVFVE